LWWGEKLILNKKPTAFMSVKKGDNGMRRRSMFLLAFLVAVGVLLVPVVSIAVPGNGVGDGNAGGNGNHYGWNKGSDNNSPVSVPEPTTLSLVIAGIAGAGSYIIIRRRQK
jgi:hypothetical protein